MRGIANEMLLSIMIIIGVAFIASYISLPQMGGYRLNLTYVQDIYTMDNALDAAKAYSRTALRYSMYQSCYDVLRSGEYEPEGGGSPVPSLDDFMANITATAEAICMKFYTEKDYVFLGSYNVKLPLYELEMKGFTPTSIKVSASGEKLSTSSILPELKATLRADSGFVEEVPTDCFGLYLKMDESRQELNRTWSEAAMPELKKWPRGELKASHISETQRERICDEVFKSNNPGNISMAQAGESIGEAILEKLGGLQLAVTVHHKASYPLGMIMWTYVSDKTETNDDGTINATCEFVPEATILADLYAKGDVKHPVFNGSDIMLSELEAKYVYSEKLTAEGSKGGPEDTVNPKFVSQPSESVGDTIARITFETDEPVKVYNVFYGYGKPVPEFKGMLGLYYSDDYAGPQYEMEMFWDFTTVWGMELKDLSPGTEYHYFMTLVDESNNALNYVGTFNTLGS